jgi:hypothetical protein
MINVVYVEFFSSSRKKGDIRGAISCQFLIVIYIFLSL